MIGCGQFTGSWPVRYAAISVRTIVTHAQCGGPMTVLVLRSPSRRTLRTVTPIHATVDSSMQSVNFSVADSVAPALSVLIRRLRIT
jgi:hypothetical protein